MLHLKKYLINTYQAYYVPGTVVSINTAQMSPNLLFQVVL